MESSDQESDSAVPLNDSNLKSDGDVRLRDQTSTVMASQTTIYLSVLLTVVKLILLKMSLLFTRRATATQAKKLVVSWSVKSSSQFTNLFHVSWPCLSTSSEKAGRGFHRAGCLRNTYNGSIIAIQHDPYAIRVGSLLRQQMNKYHALVVRKIEQSALYVYRVMFVASVLRRSS